MSDAPPSPHDALVLSAIRSMRCEMHELTERQERVTELLDGLILQVGELSSRVDATFVREGFGGVPHAGDTSGDRAPSVRSAATSPKGGEQGAGSSPRPLGEGDHAQHGGVGPAFSRREHGPSTIAGDVERSV